MNSEELSQLQAVDWPRVSISAEFLYTSLYALIYCVVRSGQSLLIYELRNWDVAVTVAGLSLTLLLPRQWGRRTAFDGIGAIGERRDTGGEKVAVLP